MAKIDTEEGMDTLVVVIPPGSPLERFFTT